jgi:hypothetical protein
VIGRYRALGSLFRVGDARTLQARIAIGLGDRAKARAYLDEAIDIMIELDNRSGLVGALLMAAVLAVEGGDGRRAAHLYAAAMKMRTDYAVGATPMEFLGVANPGERARALLGQEGYDATYREGSALAFDAVIAEARTV